MKNISQYKMSFYYEIDHNLVDVSFLQMLLVMLLFLLLTLGMHDDPGIPVLGKRISIVKFLKRWTVLT